MSATSEKFLLGSIFYFISILRILHFCLFYIKVVTKDEVKPQNLVELLHQIPWGRNSTAQNAEVN